MKQQFPSIWRRYLGLILLALGCFLLATIVEVPLTILWNRPEPARSIRMVDTNGRQLSNFFYGMPANPLFAKNGRFRSVGNGCQKPSSIARGLSYLGLFTSVSAFFDCSHSDGVCSTCNANRASANCNQNCTSPQNTRFDNDLTGPANFGMKYLNLGQCGEPPQNSVCGCLWITCSPNECT
jgi:hypothetical protein